MRKVNRQAFPPPKILSSEEAQSAYREIVAFIDSSAFDSTRRPPINNRLIRHPEVIKTLRQLFLNKCAYCELKVDENTLDHFRPVSAASNRNESSTSLVHYSWLAYEWRNLYLTCRACNGSKRNRFPVQGERAPAFYALDDVREREISQLVDPCVDTPDKCFDFTFDGRCVGKNEAGKQSIEIFDLNRPHLISQRALVFAHLIDIALHQTLGLKTDLFEPEKPHVGAFEIFARRMCAVFANNLKAPPPVRAAQLQDFERLVNLVSQDDLQTLLNVPPGPLTSGRQLDTIATSRIIEMVPRKMERLERGISRVEIQNFKGIDQLSLDIGELTSDSRSAAGLMLLADNAAGKTSVLQAIALAVMGPKRANKLKIDRGKLIRNSNAFSWGLHDKMPARVRVEFHSGQTSELILDPFSLEFSGSSLFADGLMAYGAHRLLGAQKRRGLAPTARVATLFDSRAEVPRLDEWLVDGRTPFPVVARALSEVLLQQSGGNRLTVEQGVVLVDIHGQKTPLSAVSEGYRSVIAFALDIIRWLLKDWPDLETARGVVLIDEIDAHLHPRWKLSIMSALRTAIPGVQFIATTHDPLCLRGMGKGEVVVMKRSLDQRFDLITDLPDFQAMSAEQILMSDYFGLNTTSDPEIEARLGDYADQAAGSEDLKDYGTSFDALMIGTTPEQQIADEALLRYLRERDSVSGKQISENRRAAIDTALALLKAGGTYR